MILFLVLASWVLLATVLTVGVGAAIRIADLREARAVPDPSGSTLDLVR